MNVGVVDIGTNSMRLLITSDGGELGRWVEVTGLGRGVDANGRLGEVAVAQTLEAFRSFGDLMDRHGVSIRKAIATSASRDAVNREEFFDQAEVVLGVRPTLIDGDEEARYAFSGATNHSGKDVVVSDIGGGSTEFVTASESVSIDIGSVRLSERFFNDRPIPDSILEKARDHILSLFSGVKLAAPEVIGVAGTWTSLSAIVQRLDRYDREAVHGHYLKAGDLSATVEHLTDLTVEETAMIPSLDPKRAPVIAAGAVVAESVLRHLGADGVKISKRDTLDGVAAELLRLA